MSKAVSHTLYHDDSPGGPTASCLPRIYAICCTCLAQIVYCCPSRITVGLMRKGAFRCDGCRR